MAKIYITAMITNMAMLTYAAKMSNHPPELRFSFQSFQCAKAAPAESSALRTANKTGKEATMVSSFAYRRRI